MEITSKYHWKRITPDDANYTFGYYDRNPWNSKIDKHLALRIPQQVRLPEVGETAGVGYIDRNTCDFVKLAETNTWCHQQGCMQLWLPDDTVIYNDAVKEGGNWKPITRIMSDKGEQLRQFDHHIYTLSPDGSMAASIDMARIPRRGYSYAATPFSGNEYRQPEDIDNDGLFIIDIKTGKRKLIASYRQIMEKHPYSYDIGENIIWLNHAIFNCDGSRVMILFRYAETADSYWRTFMYTMNVDGSDLQCSLPNVYWDGKISHQIWGRTPREILIDAAWNPERKFNYVVFDESESPFRAQKLSDGTGAMGHLIFSPDGELMLADTYADSDNLQHLSLLKVTTGELEEIGLFSHIPEGVIVDVRCDLHPRWSKDGKVITVDSIHKGKRGIYLLELS